MYMYIRVHCEWGTMVYAHIVLNRYGERIFTKTKTTRHQTLAVNYLSWRNRKEKPDTL